MYNPFKFTDTKKVKLILDLFSTLGEEHKTQVITGILKKGSTTNDIEIKL